MKNDEVIKALLKLKDKADSYEKKCINKAIEEIEANEPKSPHVLKIRYWQDDTINEFYCCPKCRFIYASEFDKKYRFVKFCHECGQAIDWSEYE